MTEKLHGRPASTPTVEPDRPAASTTKTSAVRFHKIVREAKGAYLCRRPAADGFFATRDVQGLKLRVSRGTLERALRVADLLLKSAEAMGYSVSVGTHAQAGAQVLIYGEVVEVGIKEGVDRIPHVPTKAELDDKKRWGWTRIPRFEYRPSGILTVVLGSPRGAQANFSEGKRWKLEQRIDVILEGMRKASLALRQERQERERWQLEWEEKRRREAEAFQRRQDEEKRVALLEKQLAAWRTTRDIRAFVDELRALAAARGREINPDDGFGQWLSWAEAYACRTDPLRELRNEGRSRGSTEPTQA